VIIKAKPDAADPGLQLLAAGGLLAAGFMVVWLGAPVGNPTGLIQTSDSGNPAERSA